MKTFAINICLIPAQPVYDICCELNRLDTSDYNLNGRFFIPHMTLVMRTVSETDLEKIITQIKAINISKIKLENKGYYAKEGGSRIWTGMSLDKNNTIKNLQNQIAEITIQFNQAPIGHTNYAIDNFYAKEVNEYIFTWDEEYVISKAETHITLGHTDVKEQYKQIKLPKQIIFNKLAIGHLGNYGSVRDILFEKELI